jgi:hypothetical protein
MYDQPDINKRLTRTSEALVEQHMSELLHRDQSQRRIRVPGTFSDSPALRSKRRSSLCTREAFMSEGVFALLLAGLVVAVLVWVFWKKSP